MGSHIFPRSSAAPALPRAVRGDGVYIIDENGKQYFDGSCGAAVSCLGHSNERVKRAIVGQLDRIAFAHTSFLSTDIAEELADRLISLAPEGLDRVYFVSGGSEAVEAALKLARQYYLERGETSRHKIIARRQSYHGNTLGALATGGNAGRRKPYQPLLVETHHIAPCYAYREQREGESETDYGLRVANELEDEILRLGPENVMAFVAETVVGSTLGAVPPVKGYFKRIREICDQYGVLLILDEIMCGMGRTGTLFACEQDGVSPDITTIAKGLGAGYQPIGAMLCTADIHDTIAQGSGAFQHGHTYLAHPTATAAALAVLSEFTERNLIANVVAKGEALRTALRSHFSAHENIGDVRGRGLFIGVELVADRTTKATLPAENKTAARLKKIAMDEGLLCYPMGGTADGVNGDHVLLAPPFIMEDEHVDEIVTKLSRALDRVLT